MKWNTKIEITYLKGETITKISLLSLSMGLYAFGFFVKRDILFLFIQLGMFAYTLSNFIPLLSVYRRQKEVKTLLIISGASVLVIALFLLKAITML